MLLRLWKVSISISIQNTMYSHFHGPLQVSKGKYCQETRVTCIFLKLNLKVNKYNDLHSNLYAK